MQEKTFIKVYVLNMRGQPLMPCSPVKARILLKQNKARVVQRTPFTIQLTIATGETKQPIMLGADSGYEHVGLSAVTEKQEVFAAEVQLRKNVSKLLTERRMYRKTRRAHKTRYRKCRFLNRIAKFKRNPLVPSIQHKLDSHLRIIDKVTKLLPITKIIVETANFDIQQLKADLAGKSNLRGNQYQQGEQLGFNNVKAYVLHRDGHKCLNCKGSSGDKHLNVHHIVQRSQGGSDRPDNLVTLCAKCHDKLHRGNIKLSVKAKLGFRAETFMSTVRKRLILRLRELYSDINETYGYLTKAIREQLGLVKLHVNDAFVIASGNIQTRCTQLLAEPKRRNNRCLQLNRKGFGPAIRKQRYVYRPKDDVFLKNMWYQVKGVHCKGSRIQVYDILGKVKSFATKLVEKHYYQNGWRFSYP